MISCAKIRLECSAVLEGWRTPREAVPDSGDAVTLQLLSRNVDVNGS